MFGNIKKIQKILNVCENPQMFFENNDLIIVDGLGKWTLTGCKTKTVVEIFSIFRGVLWV